MSNKIEDILIKKQNQKIISKISKNNEQKDFFLNCLEYNIPINMITQLANNLVIYKHLMRNNGISLQDTIKNQKEDSFYETFEELNDNVEKAIIKNKAHKLLRSVTSNKHKHLINEETKELFRVLIQEGVTREELEQGIMKKVAQFKNAEEFNKSINNKYIDKHNEKKILNIAKENNITVLNNNEQQLILLIDNGNDMAKVGTNMWCVQRSEDMFERYTKTGEYFSVSYDFSKKQSDPLSLTATIVSAQGKVLEMYDSNDERIENNKLHNDISDNAKRFTYKELIDRLENKRKRGFKTEENLYCAIAGEYYKEFNQEMAKLEVDKEPEYQHYVDVFSKYILNQGLKYKDVFFSFPEKAQEACLNFLIHKDLSMAVTESLICFTQDPKIEEKAKKIISNAHSEHLLIDIEIAKKHKNFSLARKIIDYHYSKMMDYCVDLNYEYNEYEEGEYNNIKLLYPNLIKKGAVKHLDNLFSAIPLDRKLEFNFKYDHSSRAKEFFEKNNKSYYENKVYELTTARSIAERLKAGVDLNKYLNTEEGFKKLPRETKSNIYSELFNMLKVSILFRNEDSIYQSKKALKTLDRLINNHFEMNEIDYVEYLRLIGYDKEAYKNDNFSVYINQEKAPCLLPERIVKSFRHENANSFDKKTIIEKIYLVNKGQFIKPLYEEINLQLTKLVEESGKKTLPNEVLINPTYDFEHEYKNLVDMKKQIEEHPKFDLLINKNKNKTKKRPN